MKLDLFNSCAPDTILCSRARKSGGLWLLFFPYAFTASHEKRGRNEMSGIDLPFVPNNQLIINHLRFWTGRMKKFRSDQSFHFNSLIINSIG